MDEKEILALTKAISLLLGDPLQADANELEILFAEFGEGRNPAQAVFDLASTVAKKYRLEGGALPAHVASALDSTRKSLAGDAVEVSSLDSVVDAVLRPFLGPAREVSFAFRNRKERTQKDADLLEGLSCEVKRDWTEDK